MQPLWKTVWNFLRKPKMNFRPSNSMAGIIPKNPETPIQKNLYTQMFIAALFIIAKCWKEHKCPSVNEWIKKLWYIYTMEFYAAERKKKLLPFTTTRTWAHVASSDWGSGSSNSREREHGSSCGWHQDPENIMLSEISQAVKDKYPMISPISGT